MSSAFASFNPLLDSRPKIVYGVVVILLIVYSSIVPSVIRSFADTLLGRILGAFWIYLSIELFGWIHGLLTAIAFLLILYLSPHSLGSEGFYGGPVVEKERIGKRWFVEKVLGEDPSAIHTEKVTTQAIQD